METTIQGPEWDANEGVPSDTVEWKLQFSTRFPLPSPPSAAHFQVFASVYSKKHQGWEWQSTPGGQQWPTAHRSAKSKLNNAHCPVSCSSCYNFWFPYALGSIFSVFSNIMCITCLGVSRGECSLCSCSVWNECKEITQKKSSRGEDTDSKKRKEAGRETVIKSSSVSVWSTGTEVLCMYNQSHRNDVIKIRLTLIQSLHDPSLEWLILRIKVLLWEGVYLD